MEAPRLVAFVENLFFADRIEHAAVGLGMQVHWIGRAEQVAPPDPQAPLRQPAEHLLGPGAALIALMVDLRPALVIFDLSNPAVPWRQWLPLIKSAPATRRIPAICFGPHVDDESFRWARSCGADLVVGRSRFTTALPELLKKYARQIDYEAIAAACEAPLSALALEGLHLFNHAEYFEAHEKLEEAWNADDTPGKELYRAILQVAVAYLQIERRNYRGAVKMFLRVRQWLDPLPEMCRGVDVAGLRRDAYRVSDAVNAMSEPGLEGFDHNLLKPVQFTTPTT
jgi:predicted metal-dependent hydrolase